MNIYIYRYIYMIPLPGLVQRRSLLFLFQISFVNWQRKVFVQFNDSSVLKIFSSYKRRQFI